MASRAGIRELPLSGIVVDILAVANPCRAQGDEQRVKAHSELHQNTTWSAAGYNVVRYRLGGVRSTFAARASRAPQYWLRGNAEDFRYFSATLG
jgi:hypothetical protein